MSLKLKYENLSKLQMPNTFWKLFTFELPIRVNEIKNISGKVYVPLPFFPQSYSLQFQAHHLLKTFQQRRSKQQHTRLKNN